MSSRFPRWIPAAALTAAAACAAPPEFLNHRHVYRRGEEVAFRLKVDPAVNRLACDVSGWLAQDVAAQAGEATFTVKTDLLRAADYEVRARPGRGGDLAVFPMTLVARPNPQRFPLWNWGGGHTPDVRWWAQRGFNGLRMAPMTEPLGPADYPRFDRALEEGLRYGMDMGAHPNPMTARRWQNNEAAQALLVNGKRTQRFPYALEPVVIEHARKLAASWAERYSSHPAYTNALLSSEINTPFCLNEPAVRLANEEAGLDLKSLLNVPWITPGGTRISVEKLPPELQPRDGVIPDDHPLYRFLMWWWQRGHGMAGLNAEMSRVLKEKRPDVVTWYDPYRLAPVYDSHIGLDVISTWTYGHPDIKRLAYTTVLQAAARKHQQKVMQNITMWIYGFFVVPIGTSTADLLSDSPGKDPFFTQGPDYMREALWLVMSQRPDAVNFYYASSAAPENTTLDPHRTSPEGFDAIGEISRTLIEPYGPAILASRRAKPPVAVLMSASAVWFPAMPFVPGYVNEQTLPFLSLLLMNHVPFDVLLDDDIKAGALANYDALVIGRGDTLTQSVATRIAGFAAGGRKVFADNTLRARIPGVIQTGFDFGFERDANGRALAHGKAIDGEQYRALMESYAERLKELMAGVRRPAESDSKRLLVNTIESGAVKYVFAVNDDRTPGPRFGRWKLMLESGVRQTAKVRIAISGQPVVYDAIAQRRIDYAAKDGKAEFETTLPPARGRLIAVLPEAVAKLETSAPEDCRRASPCPVTVRVLGAGGSALAGSMPLRVELIDPAGRQSEFTRYAATTASAAGDYGFTLPFLPAVNDAPGEWTVRATDLVAGVRTERKFNVH